MIGSRRVSEGVVRVDAARAVAKLRDYQLADPTFWVLEAIRAGVAAGATRIQVTGDSDEVLVVWEGKTWDLAPLTRLFDRLVSPKRTDEERGEYLLATAVNTGLAVMPRSIDIVRIEPGETPTRLRFTPDIYQPAMVDGVISSSLREVKAEPASRLQIWPTQGMIIHMRQPFRWETIWRFLRRARPAELALAHRSTRDCGVPVQVKGVRPAPREQPRRDLIRVPMGQGLDGFVALTEAGAALDFVGLESRAIPFSVAEYGVDIATLDLMPSLEQKLRVRGVALPLRVHLSASEIPTNASRSLVKTDSAPLPAAILRAGELFPVLIQTLAEELRRGGARHRELRAAALQLIAGEVGGGIWGKMISTGDYHPALEPLMDLTILRNAVGEETSLRTLASGWDARAHLEAEPLDRELKPWLETVIWAPPGDDARRLFWQSMPGGIEDLIKDAQRLQVARRAWLSRPVEAPRVTHPGVLCRMRVGADVHASGVPNEVFEGLEFDGEVALGDWGVASHGETHLLLGGRSLAWERPPGCPFPIRRTLNVDALHPKPDYSGVSEDGVYQSAIRVANGASIRLLEALICILWLDARPEDFEGFTWGEGYDLKRIRAVYGESIRKSLVLLGVYLERCFGEGAESGPFMRAPLWPSSSGASRSLLEWAALATMQGGLALDGAETARSEAEVGPEGLARESLVMDSREARRFVLRWVQRSDVPVWDHSDGLQHPLRLNPANSWSGPLVEAPELWHGHRDKTGAKPLVRPLAAFRYEAAGWQGWVIWAPSFSGPFNAFVAYRQVLLEATADPVWRSLKLLRLLQMDALMPTPTWDGCVPLTTEQEATQIQAQGELLGEFLATLAEAFIAPPSELLLRSTIETNEQGAIQDPELFQMLMRALGSAEVSRLFEEKLSHEVREALREFKGVPVWGLGFLSATEAGDKATDGAIAFVEPSSSLVAADSPVMGMSWYPISADEVFATGVSRLLGREARRATAEEMLDWADRERELLEERRAEVARERYMQRETASFPSMPDAFARRIMGGWNGWVALVEPGEHSHGICITVHVLEREFDVQTFSYPHALDVHLVVEPGRVEWAERKLSDTLWEQIVAQAIKALPRIFVAAIEAQPQEFFNSWWGQRCLAWMFVEYDRGQGAEGEKSSAMKKARTSLRDAPVFRDLAGAPLSLNDARKGKQVRWADFFEPWYAPAEGEEPARVDEPIIRLREEEERPRLFLEWLGAGLQISDLTAAVGRLQYARRQARGDIARPTVEHIAGEQGPRYSVAKTLSRKALRKLEAHAGEVALRHRHDSESVVSLYSFGELVLIRSFQTEPPIALGLEDPECAEMFQSGAEEAERNLERKVNLVARELGRYFLAQPPETWSPPKRRVLQRALILRKNPAKIERITPILPVFGGPPISLDAVKASIREHGDLLWLPSGEPCPEALPPGRLVLRLDRELLEACKKRGWNLAHAGPAVARAERVAGNRARERVTELELPPEVRKHTTLEFRCVGEGWRAIVALLGGSVSEPELRLHADGFPFDVVDSPFSIPGVVVADATGLTPDEMWESPLPDDRYHQVISEIQTQIQDEVESVLRPPEDAVVSSGELRIPVGGGEVLGRVWLGGSATGIWLHRGSERHRLTPTTQVGGVATLPLPMNGVFYAFDRLTEEKPNLVSLRVSSAVSGALKRAYEGLVRGMWKKKPEPEDEERDFYEFHALLAIFSRILSPKDLGLKERAVSVIQPPMNAERLLQIRGGDEIIYSVYSDPVPPDAPPHLVMDDSASSDLLELIFESQGRLYRHMSRAKGEGARPLRPEHESRLLCGEVMAKLRNECIPAAMLTSVQFDPEAERVASYEGESKTLTLGGQNSWVSRVIHEVSSESEEGARIIEMLSMHSLGVISREGEWVRPADELRMLQRLTNPA